MTDVPDDIFDIEETDPKKIVIAIDKLIRPRIGDNFDAGDSQSIIKYRAMIAHACRKFGVEFSVEPPADESYSELRAVFAATKAAVDRIKIDLLYEKIKQDAGLVLDDTWRGKIHGYLNAIRSIVEQADVELGIREKILKSIAEVANDVDRYRLPAQKFADVFATICEGISKGSEKLVPAVRVLERVAGAVERLRGSKPEPLALPKPDDMGLPELPELPAPPPDQVA